MITSFLKMLSLINYKSLIVNLKKRLEVLFYYYYYFCWVRKQIMAIVADFMLVWLPAPTVSLKPALAISAGPLTKFFYGCPENAFQVTFPSLHSHNFLVFEMNTRCSITFPSQILLLQVALAGTSFSFLQRVGAVVVCGVFLELNFFSNFNIFFNLNVISFINL